MADISKGDTFADGQTVTGARLNALVDAATVQPGLISGKTAATPVSTDELLFRQVGTDTLKKATFADIIGGGGGGGVLARIDLINQSANTGGTLYAVPVGQTGLYQVNWYVKVTRAATTSSTFQPVISWTDGQDSQGMVISGTPDTINSLLAFTCLSAPIWAKSGTNILVGVNYASTGGTTMQYEAHWSVSKV